MSKIKKTPVKNSKKINSLLGKEVKNSYTGLTQAMITNIPQKPQNSTIGMAIDSAYEFITLDKTELAYLYLHNPIVSTIVNKPVQDALRGGINLQCEELGSEVNNFITALETDGFFNEVQNGQFWNRLFGGAGYFINQETADPLTPFSLNSVVQGERIEIYALDRWQIQTNTHQSANQITFQSSEFWTIGGERVHNSRIIPIKNREVPSMLRGTFQNWGVSEVEKMIREMNFYLKSQNVLFELVDEAKVDIFSIKGLNDAFTDPTLQQAMHQRIWTAAQLKSYLNSLILDTEDKYESKSINFSGIKEVTTNATAGISIASGIPQDHWAGTGASGFSSGEDTIERYNSMIESDIRQPMKQVLNELIRIKMKQYYGRIFEFEIDFYPLRVLSSTQEEEVKKSQTERILKLFEMGLVSKEQAHEFLEKNGILGV